MKDGENVIDPSSTKPSNHIIEQEVNVGEEGQVEFSEGIREKESDMISEINMWETEGEIKKDQSQSGHSYNKKIMLIFQSLAYLCIKQK